MAEGQLGQEGVNMRNGICPKCGYNDVRVGAQETVTVGQAQRFAIGIRIADQSTATMTMFVCMRCCYIEHYAFEPRDMQSIADKWPRVPPQG